MKKLLSTVLAAMGILLAPQQSNAVPISANTEYNLTTGGVWLNFDLSSSNSDYRFEGTTKTGSTIKTGAINGTTLTSLDSNILLDFKIYSYNSSNGQKGAQVGTATATLSADYFNLGYDRNRDVAAGLEGKTTTDIDFSVNGAINGGNFNFDAQLMGMYANIPFGSNNNLYNNTVSAFGEKFDVAFGSVGNSQSSIIDGWVSGDTTIFGKNYHIGGDIHTGFNGGRTDVPEPATLSLLGMGGLAAAVRRRRNRKLAA